MEYLFIGICVVVFVAIWRQSHRARAMRVLAGQLGLHYLGDALPKSLLLRGTLENLTKVWNVIDGDRNGIRILAFDCQLRSGKPSWRTTVVAAETENDPFAATAYDTNLAVERCDRWFVLFRRKSFSIIPRGLMALPELEAHLRTIGK